MINADYQRAASPAAAVALKRQYPDAAFLGGGTNLLDLMKADVARPTLLIDVTRLPLRDVTELPDGGLRIGALVRNSDMANHPWCARAIRCCRRPCWPAPPRNCATWRRPVAT